MLTKLKCALAAMAMLFVASGANAAAVTIGDVTKSGDDFVITSGPGGVSVGALESFAGFAPGALTAEGLGVVEGGSALKSTVEVAAGDTLTFDWVWSSNETDSFWNDFAFVGLSLFGVQDVIASVAMTGSSGSDSFSWVAGAAGVLTYVIGVADVGDQFVTSQLTVSKLSPVPVPAAALLFGSALLGFAGFSARRKVS